MYGNPNKYIRKASNKKLEIRFQYTSSLHMARKSILLTYM